MCTNGTVLIIVLHQHLHSTCIYLTWNLDTDPKYEIIYYRVVKVPEDIGPERLQTLNQDQIPTVIGSGSSLRPV